MSGNIIVKVEFMAGTSIHDACEEARQKAKNWDVAYIKFNFNGVNISVGKYTDINEIVKAYHNKDFIGRYPDQYII